jgi:hypothetical protein
MRKLFFVHNRLFSIFSLFSILLPLLLGKLMTDLIHYRMVLLLRPDEALNSVRPIVGAAMVDERNAALGLSRNEF